MDKLRMESPDMTAQNIDRIAALFPNCVTEMPDENGKIKRAINFELLKQMLSPDVVDGDEAYEFTWVGKKAAIVEANKPIRKTLRPCVAESKDWDTTENLYIEGDNLEVLKLLQESYLGKVKMIYIDPPYNTGNDFIYADDFMRSQEEENEQMGMYDEDENRLFKNTDTNGRFHSDWCSMIYSRLMLARNLLTDDGVILVSIGDREVKNLQAILDEVFGANNQVCCFVWKSRAKPTNAGNARFRPQKVAEYILVYSKTNPDNLIFNVVPAKERTYPHNDENGAFRTTTILTSNRGTFRRDTMRFESHGYTPNEDFRWKAGKETIDRLYDTGHMYITDDGTPMEKKYSHEEADPLYPIYTYMDSDLSGTAESGKADLSGLVGKQHGFDTVKPVQLIKYLIQTFAGKDDTIFDFFAGSSTTAQAVMEQNAEDSGHRKYVLMQINEKCDPTGEAYRAGFKTICDIGLRRMTAAGDKIKSESPMTTQDLDVGFRVLKLDDTNTKDVYYAPDDYDQGMLAGLESNIKDNRTDLDLLFGCLIDWGLPLSLPYKSEQLGGCTVHTYNDGDLIACFDANIPESVVKEIAQRKPLRAVFRDSGFASSPEKINVFEIFKLYMPEDAGDITKRVRVI